MGQMHKAAYAWESRNTIMQAYATCSSMHNGRILLL